MERPALASLAAILTAMRAAAAVPPAPPPWWAWGVGPPFALQVPADLGTRTSPVWAPAAGGQQARFVLARAEFALPATPAVATAVAFVTAQQSPLCQPDPRLVGNDYGSCIPHGGTSQAKLLGAFKAFVNGVVVGTGPGRRINQTQGVDAIDISAALRPGETNAVGLEGYHSSAISGDEPRLLLLVRVTHKDGTTTEIGTSAGATSPWRVLNADALFNPAGSTGAWAGSSGMPQENLNLTAADTAGWATPGFDADAAGFVPAEPAPPFVLPLGNKPGRPVAVFERRAASVTPWTGGAGSPCAGCYVIDYGRELQGGVNLTLTGAAAGQRVEVLLSEELRPDGTPLVPMHTGNNFTSVWTLREGDNVGVMQHEYMEFRYGMVKNAPGVLTADNAGAWVVRYPLGDHDGTDDYGDTPALPPSALRRPATLASFSSSDPALNDVWGLVRYTLVACGGLDVNVDSNTRQRDFCATDAFVTGVGQLAVSSDYGMPFATAQNGFQVDSNIWQGMTDFRSALISLAHAHALYSGDLSLVRQRWEDIKKHSFVYFFDEAVSAVNKPIAFMGSQNCKCPESWSPAGMPPGIYEAVHCTCTDLNDWPRQYQDGYVMGEVSTIANAYVALAATRVAEMATWLNETADAVRYNAVADTILSTLQARLYNHTLGGFYDGLKAAPTSGRRGGAAAWTRINHTAMQATVFPLMAGVVDAKPGVPGMGLAVTRYLEATGVKCSCMGAFWLLRGLYRTGRSVPEAADFALAVLTSTEQYSWRNMIAQGATCTMETWPSGTAPHSGGTGGTWSHPWCSGPNSVIVQHLVGVQPLSPGWSRWEFAPQPSNLTAVSAAVPMLALGRPANTTVTVAQTATQLAVTLTVPAETSARVCLPPPHALPGEGAATHVTVDGKAVACERDGRLLCVEHDLLPGKGVRRVVRSSAGA